MSESTSASNGPESALLARGLHLGGDFEILGPLGHGGMGRVYLARQRSTNSLRAVKVLRDRYATNPGFRARFEREARIVGQIASEHVIKVVAAGTDLESELCWYAMELLEGSDLEEHVFSRGLPDSAARYTILQQVFHGVAAAHDLGIVHRDVKPANVFLARALRSDVGLTVKVLDFGLAKQLNSSRTTTALGGTPEWGAPEQFAPGYVPAPQSDVWALGQLVFWLHTGHVLSGYLAEGVAAHARTLGRPLPPADGWDDWFGQCVHPLQESRFCHARAAWNALAQLLTASPSQGLRIAVSSDSDPHGKTQLAPETNQDNPVAAAPPTLADTGAPLEVDRHVKRTRRRWPWVVTALGSLTALASAVTKLTHEAQVSPQPEHTPSVPSVRRPPVGIASSSSAGTIVVAPGAEPARETFETTRPSRSDGSSAVRTTTPPPGTVSGSVHIAPGNFLMGWEAFGDDHRPHRVTLTTAFTVDRTEVTVHDYADCVRAGRCTPTASGAGCHVPSDSASRDLPVNCVTRAQARAYCTQRGASLPTEAEWEYAARGADGNRYPWGDSRPTTCQHAILAGACAEASAARVGGRPAGASPAGVQDLIGNLWEWAEDDWDPTAYHVSDSINPVARAENGMGVVRGGSYRSASHHGHAAVRRSLSANAAEVDVGFRCVVRDAN